MAPPGGTCSPVWRGSTSSRCSCPRGSWGGAAAHTPSFWRVPESQVRCSEVCGRENGPRTREAGPQKVGTSWQVWGRQGEGVCGVRPCLTVRGFLWLVMHGPPRGMDSWLRGHNAPPINSGHQIQGHGRQVVPPTPDIHPQCSLVGLFTIGHPEVDKESGMTGPPTGPLSRQASPRRWTLQSTFRFAFHFVNFVILPPQ